MYKVAGNSIQNIATFPVKPGILILNPGTSILIAFNRNTNGYNLQPNKLYPTPQPLSGFHTLWGVPIQISKIIPYSSTGVWV